MDPKRLVNVSKYLSKYLRHEPEALGLVLAPGGWVEVAALLRACNEHGFAVSQAELEDVVATSDKQRFAFDDGKTRIRANQGHSAEVDLQLAPCRPPEFLFHGTGAAAVDAILASGLLKMARHHVHMSLDALTAHKVGIRHGRPRIFEIAGGRMHADGFVFFCSANGVWLVDTVPPKYLRLLPDGIPSAATSTSRPENS